MTNYPALSTEPKPPLKLPDRNGRFGSLGGRFVPEILMPALAELEEAYNSANQDPEFHEELQGLLKDYVGRETPLYEAQRLSEHLGGARIFLKREDLAHTGARARSLRTGCRA